MDFHTKKFVFNHTKDDEKFKFRHQLLSKLHSHSVKNINQIMKSQLLTLNYLAKKERPRWDLNPQPSDPKSDALSITPLGLILTTCTLSPHLK